MLDDPGAVMNALTGTVLHDRPFRTGPGGLIVIDEIDPAAVLVAWQAARAALADTGRWPVAVDPEDISERYFRFTESWRATIAAAAKTADPWTTRYAAPLDDPIPSEKLLDELSYRWPAAAKALSPLALQQLPGQVPRDALDRWIFDRARADPALRQLAEESSDVPYLRNLRDWYVPRNVSIALLPSGDPWMLPAWVDYFEADESLAAALWQWHRDFRAEPVACWGTMLQFVVHQPPRDGDQAWQLAGQLLEVGNSLQTSQWKLALALPSSGAWFLHSRP